MAAQEWLNKSFEEIRQALDQGDLSSRDLTEASLKRAKASQKDLNAFITLNEEEAMKAAMDADRRLKSGERSALLGVPVGVKDNICTKGLRTTSASKMLENFVPPYDATVVTKLRVAGAVLIGKTNLDEFSMGSSNENSHFGAVKNPWDLKLVPGGSSGGAAASVAARVTPLGLGSDTGGSIRQPCGFCGITGLKPSYGRVSRYGLIAFASSLDQVGPMATDALGAAALLETIAGPDEHDASSVAQPVPSYFKEAKTARDLGHLRGLKIGVPRALFNLDGMESDIPAVVRHSLETLWSLGAEAVEIDLPLHDYTLSAYYLISASEASSNLSRYDGVHFGYRSRNKNIKTLEQLYAYTRGEGFGAEVKLRILLGTYALSSSHYEAYYKKASQVRALIKRSFEEAFKNCDLIATPTAPSVPFVLGEKVRDPLAMYAGDVFTLPANLAGVPALSVHADKNYMGLPVGMQLVAPWWQESRLLKVAALYQAQYSGSVVMPRYVEEKFSKEQPA